METPIAVGLRLKVEEAVPKRKFFILNDGPDVWGISKRRFEAGTTEQVALPIRLTNLTTGQVVAVSVEVTSEEIVVVPPPLQFVLLDLSSS